MGPCLRAVETKADGQSHVPKISQQVRLGAKFSSTCLTANLILFPVSPVGTAASVGPAFFPKSQGVQGEGTGAGG